MIDHDTIEATDLYAMVFSDDCKCTGMHYKDGSLPCSGEVTHYRWFACSPDRGMVCSNIAGYLLEAIHSGRGLCDECSENIEDCWKVVAI